VTLPLAVAVASTINAIDARRRAAYRCRRLPHRAHHTAIGGARMLPALFTTAWLAGLRWPGKTAAGGLLTQHRLTIYLGAGMVTRPRIQAGATGFVKSSARNKHVQLLLPLRLSSSGVTWPALVTASFISYLYNISLVFSPSLSNVVLSTALFDLPGGWANSLLRIAARAHRDKY